MLKLPRSNGDTLPRSAAYVKNPVESSRLTAREYRSAWGMLSETQDSQQVWCRELTLVAASGSERPESPNRHRDRVDFIPESRQRTFWYGLSGSKVQPQVLSRYPPYSRLALERVLTAKAVGGEAESGVFSNEIK
jgi:hypothetical protein